MVTIVHMTKNFRKIIFLAEESKGSYNGHAYLFSPCAIVLSDRLNIQLPWFSKSPSPCRVFQHASASNLAMGSQGSDKVHCKLTLYLPSSQSLQSL